MERHLEGKAFVLVDSSRFQSIVTGKSWQREPEAAVISQPCQEQRETENGCTRGAHQLSLLSHSSGPKSGNGAACLLAGSSHIRSGNGAAHSQAGFSHIRKAFKIC